VTQQRQLVWDALLWGDWSNAWSSWGNWPVFRTPPIIEHRSYIQLFSKRFVSLLALEQIYRPSFPTLNLQQWTGSIYTWLTHPLLDPQKSGRVLMDHLMKMVTTALKWSYAQAETDVSSKYLETAAEQLTFRRDKIHMIDAENNKEVNRGEKQEPMKEQEMPNSNGKNEGKRGRKKRSPEEPESPKPK
jgi:hypothetical protein